MGVVLEPHRNDRSASRYSARAAAARPRSKVAPNPHRLTGPTCTAKTRSGKPCTAPPLRGTLRCAFHTPGHASRAGQVGGPRRRLLDPAQLAPFEPPRTAHDLRDLLAATIIEVRAGKLEPRVANALAYLGAGFLSCLEHTDLAEQLAALKQEVNGLRVSTR